MLKLDIDLNEERNKMSPKKGKWIMRYIVTITLLLAMLSFSCAPGLNTQEDIPRENNSLAGFWLGLWHGIISSITFMLSLFFDSISIYEIHNCGGWYDFGFLSGISVVSGSSMVRSRRNG